jgi:hypothetical protein
VKLDVIRRFRDVDCASTVDSMTLTHDVMLSGSWVFSW